ncbi:MaoC family dehydratase [Thiolinea disciformis]|uniref:MaoC family dehydratase n=1 Tax=Thiolinea disciformis TaxID=125614 RepID=UPI000367C314|nr:MaoC family dehydratase [Thiolinea disciformis]
MRFSEFSAGQVLKAGPYGLSEQELVQFATAYDPQWFHTEKQNAELGPFAGLIASGWHTCAIAMRMVVGVALAGSESFASPGLSYVKWPNPVRVNDQLFLTIQVLEARRSSKRPDLGVLRWRWQLFNQEQLEVLDLEATSLFDLSQKANP